MKYADLARKVVKPPRVLLLQPDSFVATWARRPQKPIAVGLRCISESEETTAAGEARKFVDEAVRPKDDDEATAAYNDALMRWLVGAAICDPNDSTRQHDDLPEAEETLHERVTAKTLRWLYEELERLQVESSPLHPMAGDSEVIEMRELLFTDALRSLSSSDQATARRYLMFVLDMLRETVTEEDESLDE